VNSTALWARADFARNLTWRAQNRQFLHEIIARDAQNRHSMSSTDAVDFAYRKFGLEPTFDKVSPYIRGVLVNWLNGQRAAEYSPTWSWRNWAAIQLATMMMLSPEVQLA
jgi:hypothetical protein